MACSSVVSLARAADTLRLDWETSEREHRTDVGAIWCDAYRLSFIRAARAHSMREQPVKKFMLCCDESARVPYCKRGCNKGSTPGNQPLRVLASMVGRKTTCASSIARPRMQAQLRPP
jgi:hypothetical protein